MSDYAPATIKRIAKLICENPGVTAGQIAAACNLDAHRCLATLKTYGKALDIDQDPRTKRFYPAKARKIKRNTKQGKIDFELACIRCLQNLPKSLGKIADLRAAAKRKEEAYLKEKARQAQARKASWELEQAKRAQRAALEKQELERQRQEFEQNAAEERKAVEEKSFHRQKLQSIKVMDAETLSRKITAPEFSSEPEDIQLAMTNKLLERLDSPKTQEVKITKHWNAKYAEKIFLGAVIIAGAITCIHTLDENLRTEPHPCEAVNPPAWCAQAYPRGYGK